MSESDRTSSLGDRLVLEQAEISAAIRIIEETRQTHLDWIAYLGDSAGAIPDEVVETAGDTAHHEACVRDYDVVLTVLRRWEGFHRSFLADLGLLLEGDR